MIISKDKIQLKTFTVAICLIISFAYLYKEVQAKELCDCYGSCTIIHPRKVNSKTKKAIKVRDGYPSDAKVDIDHILPLSLGGANNPDNLQAISKEVHRVKTEHDNWLLYYVKNCFMTLEEAQTNCKKPQKNF